MNLNFKISKNMVIAGLSVVSAGTLGYASYLVKKTRDLVAKLEGKVDAATDKLSEDISDRACDTMIEEAVQKAVDGRIDDEVRRATEEVVASAQKAMRSDVFTFVHATWDTMKKGVKDDLMNEVGKVDISEMKSEALRAAKKDFLDNVEDVVEKALDDMREKYDDLIDDMHDKYEEKLDGHLDKMDERIKNLSGVRYTVSLGSPRTATDAAINALLSSALNDSSEYRKHECAKRIVDLVTSNKDGYIFAIDALRKLNEEIDNTFYSSEIADMIVKLSKGV